MSNNISYEILKDVLVGDFTSEDNLVVVLNFLEHAASIIRILHLAQCIRNEQCDLNDGKTRGVN